MEYKTYTLTESFYQAKLQQLSEKGFSLTALEKGKTIFSEYSVNYKRDIHDIITDIQKKKLDPQLEALVKKLVVGVWKKVK